MAFGKGNLDMYMEQRGSDLRYHPTQPPIANSLTSLLPVDLRDGSVVWDAADWTYRIDKETGRLAKQSRCAKPTNETAKLPRRVVRPSRSSTRDSFRPVILKRR